MLRRTALVLLTVVVLTLLVSGSALAFTDVSAGHPYRTAINELSTLGVIAGFEDGTFRPDAPVTRQQFAKMIVKTLGLEVNGSEVCPFTDVPNQVGIDPMYPSKYVAVCAAHGITLGKTSTRFAPADSITRQQLITMITRAANLPSPPSSYVPPFSPGQFSPQEHYQNATKAAYAGLLRDLQGLGAGFNFFAPASRGECSQLLWNLLEGPGGPPASNVIKYYGSGDQVIDVEKWPVPALVWIQGNAGSRHFAVTSYGPGSSGPYSYYDLLVNTTDPYEGISLMDYFYWSFGDPEHTTRFEIKAMGAWKIEIRPLNTARTVNCPGSISGSGDDVLLVTGSPGKATINGNAGSRYFGVHAYYGQTVMYDLLVNETDPYSGTVMFSKANAKVITVQAEGPWSIALAR